MREILDANILFLSLCPKGANGFATLYKADTGNVELTPVIVELEKFDELGQLAAVVYAPDLPDQHDDFASASAIKKMAHTFIRNGAKLDLVHSLKELPKDAVYVAESFIIQKGDPRFASVEHKGESKDVTGGWGTIIQINDAELRKAYRNGEWAGMSMYGPAKVRNVDPVVEKTTKQETDMTDQEIKTLIAKGVEEGVKDALAEKALHDAEADKKKADDKKKKKKDDDDKAALAKKSVPADLDLSDADAVNAHVEKMEMETLEKAVDWTDPKSIRDFQDAVRKLKTVKKAADSNFGIDGGTENENEETDAVLRKMGRNHAKVINERRGL